MATQAEIGARLRAVREQVGLSQEEFAEAVKRDQTAISQYENGRRKLPAYELYRFAEVLGVPIQHFFDESVQLDELDQLLLREFHKLQTAEMKSAILQIMKILVRAFNPTS